MKKSLFALLFLCFCLLGVCQKTNTKKSDTLLKELSENACTCIDSVDTRNKSNVEITREVSTCIDKQVVAYQLGSALMNVDLKSDLSATGNKTIKIEINTNKNSKDYKENYYKLESYLMENCKAVKNTVGATDIEDDKSVSENKVAREQYSKGIDFFKAENYKKALPYFEKAVKADSTFVFAWDNLGICYRKLDNYDAAIYAYNKSLAINPNGIMPLQNIAVAYEYKKEYLKEIKAYESLSELDSFNPEVYYGIGRVYTFYLNDIEKGLDNICKAYNLYIKQKSPYRVDAETLINQIYNTMKENKKTDRFNEILKINNINADFK